MIVQVLAVILEAVALVQLRPLKKTWLSAFLSFLLAYDVIGFLIPSFNNIYWYYYWCGRSIGIILQALVYDEFFKDKHVFAKVWSTCVIALICVTICIPWIYPTKQTLSLILKILVITSVLNIFLIIAAWISTRSHLFFVGAMLWPVSVLVTLQNIQWYPLISLLPLAIWISSSIVSRKQVEAVAQKNSSKRAGEQGEYHVSITA